MTVRLLITGASGRLGRHLVAEFADASVLRLLARRRDPGAPGDWIAADLREPAGWSDAFAGIGTVIHLAGDARPDAPWSELAAQNVTATWNVIEAAARHGVPRVVLASSRWAVMEWERRLAPACYEPDGPKIDSSVPPRPIGAYGLSKACAEMIGREAVDAGRLAAFVAVRIGTHHLDPPADDVALLRRWLAPADVRSLFRRTVEAEISGFHVVYGVSAQRTSPYDLSYTRALLGWTPARLPPGYDPETGVPSRA